MTFCNILYRKIQILLISLSILYFGASFMAVAKESFTVEPPKVNGVILNLYCNKFNSPVLCLAAGYKKGAQADDRIPILFESNDGGKNWIEISFPNLVDKGYWHSVTCNLDNSLCIATGVTPIDGKRQMLAQSIN